MLRLTVWAWAALSACAVAGTTIDAIHDADLIVVGSITGGSAVDHVANVECSLSVRADRILKGDPGLAHTSIQVHWHYQPPQNQPPEVTTRIEHPHGMWFLKKAVGGRYEAMWVEINLQNRGGYYLELPLVEPYGAFAYPGDADPETKLAGELGAALEQIAIQSGSGLDMAWRNAGTPGPPPPQPSHEVLQFRSLAFAFRALDVTKTLTVSRYLADAPSAHLKALGIFGQLKGRNASALVELENNLPALTVTDDPLGLSFWAAGIDIRANIEAIRAVGRIATAETQLLGFTDLAVGQLSHTGNPASIPYLEVMLHHPKLEVRAMAAGGICAAFLAPELKELANAEFQQQICGPETHRVDQLKTWLAEHRTQISAVMPYPRISPPGWYAVAPELPRHEVEVSLERRFDHLLLMLPGATTEEPQERFVRVGLRNMEPAAGGILNAICNRAIAKRKELDQDYQRISNAARVQRKDVDPASMLERARQYQQISSDALSQAQSQLPGDAWLQFREFLLKLPLHEYSPPLPNPFFGETRLGERR